MFLWLGPIFIILLGIIAGSCKPRTEPSLASSAQSEEFSESTIETLLRRTGGDIPATLASFLAKLQKELPASENSHIAIAMVPRGRSLQKDSVSFKEPRIIGAPFMEIEKLVWPQLDLGMKIFFGYADRARQLEIISWTPATRKFDFFIIENMKSEAPHFKKVDAAVCTVCHQHRGPLLQALPWPDTNLIKGFVRDKLISVHGLGSKYLGLPVHPENPDDYLGDLPQLIAQANQSLVLPGKMCNTLCDDVKCLRLLAKERFKLNPPEQRDLLLATIKKNWPKDDFALPNAALPVAVPGYRPEHGIFELLESVERNNEETAMASLKLDPRVARVKIDLQSRPATPAERMNNFIEADMCFTFTDRDIKTMQLYSDEQIAAIIAGKTFRNFIDTAPVGDLNNYGLMRGILLALGTPENEIPSRYFLAHRQKNDASNSEQLKKLRNGPATNAFAHFCAGCHGVGEIATELPLRDQRAMSEYRAAGFGGQSIAQLLSAGEMPPLTPAERQAIGFDGAVLKKMLGWLTAK